MNDLIFSKMFEKINKKAKGNHISAINLINNTDVVFSLSFLKEEKIVFSINNLSPFICLLPIKEKINNTANHLSEILRRDIKDSFIKEISRINNDRIIIFELLKNVSLVIREKKYLVLELIPKRPRLIILNEEGNIIYSSSYDNILNNDRIIQNKKYEAPEKKVGLLKENHKDIDFEKEVEDYLKSSIKKGIKERHEPLFSFLKKRLKTLNNKIEKLKIENEEGKIELKNKDIGDALLYLEDEDLNSYIKENKINYDISLTKYQNAERFYKKYKKAKGKIEASLIQIEKAKEEIEELRTHQDQLLFMDEVDILYLEEKYVPKKMNKNKRMVIESKLPYFITYKGIKIGFGKNDAQNDHLTFELANRNDNFLHIQNSPGPHVVIFSDSINDELIDVASDIAIYLANKEEGTVLLTKVRDVKKTSKLGLVNLKNEALYRVDKVKDSTIKLLNDATKFSH